MNINIKDPGSALTHFIAMILAIAAAIPLITKAACASGRFAAIAVAVFIVSMILLYAASTIYHTLDISEHVNKILKKIDHMMIFILIFQKCRPRHKSRTGILNALVSDGLKTKTMFIPTK